MSSNAERAAVLTRALRARIAGDRAAMSEVYTDDVRAWTPTLSVSSLSELLVEFDRQGDAFTDAAIEIMPLDVGGDYACAEWSVTMTHSGSIEMTAGTVVEPTGAAITVHGVTIAEFRDDRICSLRQHWDELELLGQLGFVRTTDDIEQPR
jgi:ketosteroid isomerase-like protein